MVLKKEYNHNLLIKSQRNVFMGFFAFNKHHIKIVDINIPIMKKCFILDYLILKKSYCCSNMIISSIVNDHTLVINDQIVPKNINLVNYKYKLKLYKYI